MLEKLIYTTAIALGFILIFIYTTRYKNNHLTNIYLVLLIFLYCIRLINKTFTEIAIFSYYQKQIAIFCSVNAIWLFYSYLKKIIYSQKTYKTKELLHFIGCNIIVVIFYIGDKNKNIFPQQIKFHVLILFTYSLVYFIAVVKLTLKNTLNHKSDFLVINIQNKDKKKWILMIVGAFILLFFKSMYKLVFNDNPYNNFLIFDAIIWIAIYLKVLYTPEFVYGHEMFRIKNKEFQRDDIVFGNIWIFGNTNSINTEALLLKEKINPKIEEYILSIENIALNTEFFFDEKNKLRELAYKLNIPKSHLKYIFKYHSTISFIDFKKLVRIHKTILLIKQGYLNNNTLESLAEKVGFSSYSPFFKNFKSITGVSPNKFIRSSR